MVKKKKVFVCGRCGKEFEKYIDSLECCMVLR